ncbi:chain length determination protein [Vespertiliibacter pulmonis]|uniref:Chain length determinant protein (Polysaccharide antigen chain regulator) n=1 Tax=Vespertiliibacter pulmonis TaxID=1443036 RepID=A0A3N4VIR3_9PAST|nr:Wzz/FepE/Etk N-terminal domain-containing protein [Vespertiliibacter pulmonis]QLB20577.1 chain length determination protein [Vespertiliibacter pulmonis]RPE82708.1 chain length determinant protein (polysaccharide antigen chain regulator) [Vespertiliibacter pulmonis]
MNTSEMKQNSSASDEIDLIELFKVLWNKKRWIALSTVVCTAISGVYAFTAKEQWSSSAEVVAPRSVDLGNYLTLREGYARIFGEQFDVKAFTDSLYGKFKQLSYSLDAREEFFEESELFKRLSVDKNDSEKRKIINELVREKVSIVKPDPKKDPNALGNKYTFSAETAELAQSTLKEFIGYINKKAFQLDLKEFGIVSTKKIADLKFEREKLQKDLDIEQRVKLENLSKALDAAEKAGIKEYSKALGDNSNIVVSSLAMSDTKIALSDSKLSDSNYLFMLGEKYLKAQIESIKDKDIIYPPRLYQIEEQLRKLQELFSTAKDIDSATYRYLSSPDYPVAKDKPKKLIILLIGMFLGLLLSSCIILILRIFKN